TNLLVEIRKAKQTALDEKKRSGQAAVALAHKHLDDGDLRRARQEAERALSIDPEAVSGKEALAEIVRTEQKLPVMLRDAAASLQKGDDNAAETKVRAILRLQRDFGPALQLKDQIAERLQRRGEELLALADALAKRHDFSGAILQLEK